MCGIAGIFDIGGGAPVDAEVIHRMCHTLIHRGPDDEGTYVQKGIALGVRRLSIIDLVTGHQPVHNEDGNVWVVFNGEIFNFRELRAELEGLARISHDVCLGSVRRAKSVLLGCERTRSRARRHLASVR